MKQYASFIYEFVGYTRLDLISSYSSSSSSSLSSSSSSSSFPSSSFHSSSSSFFNKFHVFVRAGSVANSVFWPILQMSFDGSFRLFCQLLLPHEIIFCFFCALILFGSRFELITYDVWLCIRPSQLPIARIEHKSLSSFGFSQW